ncbi:putative transmembrane Protein [Cryptosporidium meleagridis]
MPLSNYNNESIGNVWLGNYSRKNSPSQIKKININKNTISFIKTVSQLLIIDIIFIISNIYIDRYMLSFLKSILMLVINILIIYLYLFISRRLDICSSKLVSNLENKLNLNILEAGSSSNKFLGLEIQCLNSLRFIENGLISTVHLIFYPVRFGFFGYIFFNNNWNTFLFVNKVIELLIFTTIFECLKIKLLSIPEQKSLILNISNYFDNLKTLLLLSNHREVFINTQRKIIGFTKGLLSYLLVIFQSICTIYLVFKIVRFFDENSHKFGLSQIYIFNYWFAIYLLYSARHINSFVYFIIHFRHSITLFQLTSDNGLNISFIPQNISYFDKNQISEPLIDFKDSDNEFKLKNNYDTISKKYPIIHNIDDDLDNRFQMNYSISEKVSDKINFKSNGTNFGNKNYAILENDHEFNFQIPNTLFNRTIISYKNLSISYENKFKKQIQNSSNKFKFLLNLIGKRIGRTNCSLSDHYNNHMDIVDKELMEHRFYLSNINLSIKMNEIIIIFGSDDKVKELLTKFVSGFPGIQSNEQLKSHSTNLLNYDVFLMNRNMLEFVSNFFEHQNSEFIMEPFDFILSGKPFNKHIFEIIYDSFLSQYFTKIEPSHENTEIIKNYIYPKVESIQQFVEAKIFLQLSQFFYNILTTLDNYSSAIVIIDGIFELLLPETYIKLIEKILPNNSIFSEFNISFIISTNSDLFPHLSYLYQNNSYVKLAMINTGGLYFTKDNYLKVEIKNKFVENLPSIDNTINEIFNINSKNNNNCPCSTSISSISRLFFRRFEIGNFYSSKYLIFVFFIALFSFALKLTVFSCQNLTMNHKNVNIYNFFVLETLSFYNLYSLVITSRNSYSNGLSSMLIGYGVISLLALDNCNTFFSESNFLKNNETVFNKRQIDNFKEIPEFLRDIPEKNYSSSHFIQFNGKQILRTRSLFYKDHFLNSKTINIPGIKPTGFKNALISSKKIRNTLKWKSKKESNIKLLQKYEQFTMEKNHKFKFDKNTMLILAMFFFINIVSKVLINILIFGISLNNLDSMSYNCFHEFLKIILSSDDPISVINDIEIRKNRYCLYLFKEIYNKRSKVTIHYLTLIHFLNLILFFGISNNLHYTIGIRTLMNKNLLIITILLPILYNIISFSNINIKKTKYSNLGCNSFDYYYYLNKSNSLPWFKHQSLKLLKLKQENLKEFSSFKMNLLLNSLILSISVSFLYFLFNYKKNENNQQLTIDLITLLPIIFFLIQSIHFHIAKGSKTNKSHKLNLHSYIRWLKISMQKAYYFPIYINKSVSSTSPKTNISFSSKNRNSILFEDGYELSTPISGDSLKIDPIISISSTKVNLSSNTVLILINPLIFLDNSLTFGYGKSPLFPIKQLKTAKINNFDRIAVVSNHNLISSYWTINMVLDPKDMYKNDNNTLLDTLKSLDIFPNVLDSFDKNVILNMPIREYLEFFNSQVIVGEGSAKSDTKIANFGLDVRSEDLHKLGQHKSKADERLQCDTIYIKKLLLFGHFALYSMYYRELILHLDYNMDLNVWISLVKQFFDNEKSLINNIIIISTEADLPNIIETETRLYSEGK